MDDLDRYFLEHEHTPECAERGCLRLTVEPPAAKGITVGQILIEVRNDSDHTIKFSLTAPLESLFHEIKSGSGVLTIKYRTEEAKADPPAE